MLFLRLLPVMCSLTVLFVAFAFLACLCGGHEWARGRWAELLKIWMRAWRGDQAPLD